MSEALSTLTCGQILAHAGRNVLLVSVDTDSIEYCELHDATFIGAFSISANFGALTRDVFADPIRIMRATSNEFLQSNVVGNISKESLKLFLENGVLHSIKRYHDVVHAPKSLLPYTRGERVPYAGRVFDHEEMELLGEAALEFWLTTGRFSDQFEREFAKYLGLRFSALVNSGSSANLVAFSALTSPKLKERAIVPGDEVITVAAGFPTTVTPTLQNGCIPVFVDIRVDDGTYNIDVSQLEAALSPRTKAVMVAHTLGNPFDLDTVTSFCQKHSLWLIEDNCDALGSRYDGKLTGTFGDLATSSFYPPHHLTMGEGGAVYSKHLKLKTIVESFRDWGRDCWCPAGKDNTCGIRFQQQLGDLPLGYDHKYTYSHAGYNLKVTDLQAAIGLAQLKKLDSFVAARRENWNELRRGCADLEEHFILPEPTPKSDPSWFGFLLTVRDPNKLSRQRIVSFLEEKQIQTRMLFAGNLTKQPFLTDGRYKNGFRVVGDLTATDQAMNNTFWVGVYPGLKPGMVSYMIDMLHEAVKV